MVNSTRMEHDFLGSREIPGNAYYGVQTIRAVENFPITGYRIHEELIKAMAIVKKAAALSNMETKRLAPEIGENIVKAAEELIKGGLHDHIIVDPIQGGAGTSMATSAVAPGAMSPGSQARA